MNGNRLARRLVRIIMNLLARVEVHGYENLPPAGSYTIAANHLGRLDVPLVYYVLDRTDVIVLIAEKYSEFAIFRWFARKLNSIFIDRYNPDIRALRETLNRMKRGEVLVVAPEGTRSPTEALIEARPGVSYLAAKAGVPVVPVAISGSEDRLVKAQLLRFKRPLITIRIGEPFMLQPLASKDREEVLKQHTDEIMCQIAALLPPKYHGFYTNHPRLRELLQE